MENVSALISSSATEIPKCSSNAPITPTTTIESNSGMLPSREVELIPLLGAGTDLKYTAGLDFACSVRHNRSFHNE